MKYKFSLREETIEDLKYKNSRKINTHKNLLKFKLVGYFGPYYKYPIGHSALWVRPELWSLY